MKYEAIEPYEKDEILYTIFKADAPHIKKVKHMLSSIHYYEADFFVDIFKRIMGGNDLPLKIKALRATEEAMQSKGTSIGADTFIAEINRFKANFPEYSDEMDEILSEVCFFQTLYSEDDSTER